LSASKAVARARREKDAAENPQLTPGQGAEPDLVIGYQDGRSEVSAKDAAKDLASYRARLAEELLQGTDLGTAAMRASGVQQEAPVAEQQRPEPVEPQPEPQQQSEQERTHYTRHEVEWAAIAQLQDYQDRVGAILLSIRGVGVPPELANIQTP